MTYCAITVNFLLFDSHDLERISSWFLLMISVWASKKYFITFNNIWSRKTYITNSELWLILIWICKAWKRLSQCSPSSFFKRLKMHHNLCPCCSLSLKTTTTIPWRLGFPKSSVKTISFVFMSVTDNSKLTQNTNYVIVHFEKHSIKVESSE